MTGAAFGGPTAPSPVRGAGRLPARMPDRGRPRRKFTFLLSLEAMARLETFAEVCAGMWETVCCKGCCSCPVKYREGARSPGPRMGRQVMRQQELGVSGLLGPLELIKHFPGQPSASTSPTLPRETGPTGPEFDPGWSGQSG